MYHQIPVAISLTSSPTAIVAGNDVTLSCSISPARGVSGTPFFQWEGPGVNDSNIIRERLYSQVFLNEITTSQAGVYNCSVSHSLGYMTTYIPVNVNSMYFYKHTVIVSLLSFSPVETPIPSISLSNTPLVTGSELSLSCDYTLSSSVDVAVAEQVIWTVNGSVVGPDQRISTDEPTLTFSPLTTSDSGSYVCTLVITAPQSQHITVGSPAESQEEIIAVMI